MNYTYFNKNSSKITLMEFKNEDEKIVKRIVPMVSSGELNLQEAFNDDSLKGFYVEFFQLGKGLDLFHINYMTNNNTVVDGKFVHNKQQKNIEEELFDDSDTKLKYPYLIEKRINEKKIKDKIGHDIHDKLTDIIKEIGFLLLSREEYADVDFDFYKQLERDSEF